VERNCISSLERHGNALKKECCLSGVFYDSDDIIIIIIIIKLLLFASSTWRQIVKISDTDLVKVMMERVILLTDCRPGAHLHHLSHRGTYTTDARSSTFPAVLQCYWLVASCLCRWRQEFELVWGVSSTRQIFCITSSHLSQKFRTNGETNLRDTSSQSKFTLWVTMYCSISTALGASSMTC